MNNPSEYIWSKIAHLEGTISTTRGIEDAVKLLFTEIGAISAPYGYIVEGKPFPAHICTSVNDVPCHGVPDDQLIDWSRDIVNVDISFKWQGTYYDTCRSWGSQPLSNLSRVLTHSIAKYVIRRWYRLTTQQIGAYTEKRAAMLGIYVLPEYGGHGIGAEMHMPPFIPTIERAGDNTRIEQVQQLTIEPIITDGFSYAQTEVQLHRP